MPVSTVSRRAELFEFHLVRLKPPLDKFALILSSILFAFSIESVAT